MVPEAVLAELPEDAEPEPASASALAKASSVTGLVDPEAGSVASATPATPGQTPIKSPVPKKLRMEEDDPMEAAPKEDINSMPTLDFNEEMFPATQPTQLFAEDTSVKPVDADAAKQDWEKFGAVTDHARMKTWLFSSPCFKILRHVLYHTEDFVLEELTMMLEWPQHLSKEPIEQLMHWRPQKFQKPFPFLVSTSAPDHELKSSTLDMLVEVVHDLIAGVKLEVEKRDAMSSRFEKIHETVAAMEKDKIAVLDRSAPDYTSKCNAIQGWASGQRKRMDLELNMLEEKLEESGSHSVYEVARLLSFMAEFAGFVEQKPPVDPTDTFIDELTAALDSQISMVIAADIEEKKEKGAEDAGGPAVPHPAETELLPAVPNPAEAAPVVPGKSEAVVRTPQVWNPNARFCSVHIFIIIYDHRILYIY